MDKANPANEAIERAWDPRAMYKFWFSAWSRVMDDYLRSDAFLRLMQQGFGSPDSNSKGKAGR
jgi:hypothetical protein